MSPSAHVQSDVAITTVGFHVDRSMTLSFQTICQVFSMHYNQSFHQVTCSIQLIGSLFLPWTPLNSYASSIFLEYLHFTEMSYLINNIHVFSLQLLFAFVPMLLFIRQSYSSTSNNKGSVLGVSIEVWYIPCLTRSWWISIPEDII